MNGETASRLGITVVMGALLWAVGCVDTNAVYDKVVEECRLAPELPSCAFNAGGDVLEYAAKKSFAESVDDAIEFQCIMDVDCSDERLDSGESTLELLQCFTASTAIDINASAFGGPECKTACSIEFNECGASATGCYPSCPGECDVGTVDACFRRRDACREWCNLTLGFGETRDPQAMERARLLNETGSL